MKEDSFNIADTRPTEQAAFPLDGDDGSGTAACIPERVVAQPDQFCRLLFRMLLYHIHEGCAGNRSLLAVSKAIRCRQEPAGPGDGGMSAVATLFLTGDCPCCDAPNQFSIMRVFHCQRSHLTIDTVVPLPSSEWISKSSINRLAPGSPSPIPLEVENPSCIA